MVTVTSTQFALDFLFFENEIVQNSEKKTVNACVGPIKGLSQTVSACMAGERQGSVRACMRE